MLLKFNSRCQTYCQTCCVTKQVGYDVYCVICLCTSILNAEADFYVDIKEGLCKSTPEAV